MVVAFRQQSSAVELCQLLQLFVVDMVIKLSSPSSSMQSAAIGWVCINMFVSTNNCVCVGLYHSAVAESPASSLSCRLISDC